jgi:transposase
LNRGTKLEKIIEIIFLLKILLQMPKKKYIVTLTEEEQAALEKLVNKGKNPAYKVNHARILLLADTNQSGGGWKDRDISQALKISVATIERVRQRLVEQGLEAALNRKEQQKRKQRLLDGEKEAHLIALTCSLPPEGKGRWTMKMLAERMVELGHVETISDETVRQTLKKMNSSPG